MNAELEREVQAAADQLLAEAIAEIAAEIRRNDPLLTIVDAGQRALAFTNRQAYEAYVRLTKN